MFPFFYPPPNQKSIKEQIEEAEQTIKFFKEHFKEEKKPKSVRDKKIPIVDALILWTLGMLVLSLPIALWMIHMLHNIKEAFGTL